MAFYKKTLSQVPLRGKTILLRADYNVPQDKDGAIRDDYRIRQSLPTVEYLLQQGCKVVVCSHLGRPEGKPDARYSLAPVAKHLQQLLGKPVIFVSDCVGDVVQQTITKAKPGHVLLLENLRFHEGEEANDRAFARQLARDSTASYFVQDGFGVVHRAHASTEAVCEFLPSVAGLLLAKEYTAIAGAMQSPEHPLTVVLGGAKVADKIALIEKFIDMADTLIIGGAIANTFLKFHANIQIGKSVHDADGAKVVARLMQKTCQRWCTQPAKPHCDCLHCPDCAAHLLLPEDAAVGKAPDVKEERREVPLTEVGEDDFILDMGQQTIAKMVEVLQKSRMVLWNGTLGYAEVPQFAYGSNFVAGTLASQHAHLKSIVGGGDTADFVIKWAAAQHKPLEECFNHVSTGGGASLDLMAGKKLPGIEALLDV